MPVLKKNSLCGINVLFFYLFSSSCDGRGHVKGVGVGLHETKVY